MGRFEIGKEKIMIRENTDLLAEYDDILLGKRNNFSGRFFNKEVNVASNEENALYIMKYAFTHYLRWSPEDLEANLNYALMKKLRLLSLMRYIDYPVEYDKHKDFYYLVTLTFRKNTVTIKSKTIHTYEKILSGEQKKYPKDYFLGSEGFVRAGVCLQYMIEHFVHYETLNELYGLFASRRGTEILKENKLLNVAKDIFETPVDYFNFSIPKDQRNEELFHYYKFKYLCSQATSSGKNIFPENIILDGNLP